MAQLSVVTRDAEITERELEVEDALMAGQCQYRLVQRLIAEGSDALAFHVWRRLRMDRARAIGSKSEGALTWAEIAERAKRECLLNVKEARLLRRLAG